MAATALEKKTLNFRAGDFEKIARVYRKRGINPSEVIRRIVSDFVDQLPKETSND